MSVTEASSATVATPRRHSAQAPHSGAIVVAAGEHDLAAVLRAAGVLGARLHRDALVVSTLDPTRQYAWHSGDSAQLRQAEFAMAGARRERLERALGTGEGAPRWSVAIELGGAPRVLARVAREVEAPLLVMGLGRHRPIDRLLGMETVLRTLRHVSCPVLAVPPAFDHLPRVVAVGVDFSASCQYAARRMLSFIESDATVYLVHVWQPSDLADEASVAKDDAYRASLPDRFRTFVESLDLPAGIDIRHEVREGRPADRLLDFADARHAELVVVGRRGHGLLDHLLVGGVAARVVRGSACAVLVVPEPALHEPEREHALHGLERVVVPPDEWVAALEEFSRHNAGRVSSLETSDASASIASREVGYVFFGAVAPERAGEVEIVLGEPNGRRRHLTRVIPDASTLLVYRDEQGTDRALRVDHGSGRTMLTFVPATRLVASPPEHAPPRRRRATDRAAG